MQQCKNVKYVIGFLLICLSLQSIAQSVHGNWLNYTTYEGLPHNQVICITKDSSGFIWIGTAGGLSRFDGVRFTNYYHNPNDSNSLPSNDIRSLFVDNKNRLWIATTNGLCCFDLITNKKTRFYHNAKDSNSIANNLPTFITQDKAGQIWIGLFSKGIDRYNERLGTFSHYNFVPLDSRAYNANECYGVVNDLNGNFWIRARSGITCFNPVTCISKSFYPTDTAGDKFLSENFIASISYENSHSLLLGNSNKIYRFDLLTNTFDTLPVISDKKITVQSLSVKNEKEYYLATPIGLGIYNIQNRQFYYIKPKLKNRFSIISDTLCYTTLISDGILFVGFAEGLSVLSPASQILQPHELKWDIKKKFTPRVISQLIYIPKGNYYFVATSYDLGIYLFHPDSGIIRKITGNKVDLDKKYLHEEDRVKHIPAVYKAAAANKINDLYFCATHLGVFCFNVKTEALYKYSFEAPDSIKQIASTDINDLMFDKHNTLWVVTRKHLLHIDISTNTLIAAYNSPAIPEEKNRWSLSSIFQLKNGEIWVATSNNRVFALDCKRKTLVEIFNSNGKAKINSRIDYLKELNDSIIYIGTYTRGLAAYFPTLDSLYFFSNNESFEGNEVFGMQIDANNGLWVSTNTALNYLSADVHYFKNFTKYNGYEIENVKSLFTFDSLVVLSLGNAIAQIDINHFWKDATPPKVTITSISVHNQPLQLDTNIAYKKYLLLDYTQNTISIEFSAPNFSGGENILYYYQLENFNTDWVNNGKRNYISFAQLPPGKYVLKIKAQNTDGIWSKESAFLNITITPPYWQTWWFKALIAFTILNFIYLLYNMRIKQVKREVKLKADYQQQIAELENKALRAQMNPHFIFNCLNSINRYIVMSDPDTASNYVTKFSRLIRLILDNSRASEVSLSNELQSLQLYIEMESLRFRDKFNYRMDVSNDINIDNVLIPPLILQPYVENAIWHGLMHLKFTGQLTITIYADKPYLIIKIDDNGVGRKASKVMEETTFKKNKSHGMLLTGTRLALFNNNNVENNVTITDKVDEQGNGVGTLVTIRLLLKNKSPIKQNDGKN